MVNNVVLVGRLTKDPRIAKTEKSTIANFTVAVNRSFKNPNGENETDFIDTVAFSNTAEFVQKYVTKGALVAVTGRIQTRSYEKDGVKRYVTEVVAESVTLLSSVNKQEDPDAKLSIVELEKKLEYFKTQANKEYEYLTKGLKNKAEKEKVLASVQAKWGLDIQRIETLLEKAKNEVDGYLNHITNDLDEVDLPF